MSQHPDQDDTSQTTAPAEGTGSASTLAEGTAVTWMEAKGYTVAAGPEHPGVEKLRPNGSSTPITSAPINIIEVGQDDHGVRHTRLRWVDGPEIDEWAGPRGLVFGKGLVTLAEIGAPVHPSNCGALQAFLQAQEQGNHTVIPRVHVYTAGWNRDFSAYVYGDQLVGATGRVFSSGDRNFLAAMRPRGDKEEYMRLAAEARDKSPAAEMAWAAGYAAALIRPLGLRSFVLSVWYATGAGKSAAQALAASAWGRPRNMKQTGNMSQAALEIFLSSRNDSLLWIDDTQQSQTETFIEQLAYSVGGDTSAARANQDGTARPSRTWSSLTFVSGERPIHKKGAAGGAQNRSIEVHARPFGTPAYASHLHRQLDANHGWTGPLFIKAIQERFVRTGELHKLCELFRDVERMLAPNHDEVSEKVSVLVLADILCRVFVWGEAEDAAEDAAFKAGRAVLELARAEQKDTGCSTDEHYQTVCSWVAEKSSCFVSNPVSEGQAPLDLYGRFERHDGRRIVAVLPNVLEDYLKKKNINLRAFLKELEERDLFIRETKDSLARRTVLLRGQTGKDRPRCYWIVLDGEKDEASPTASTATTGDQS